MDGVYERLHEKPDYEQYIRDIRNVLNFMEGFDTLVGKAQETGDTEWENDLYAGECSARYRLRELIGQLLGDVRQKAEIMDEEPFWQQNQE